MLAVLLAIAGGSAWFVHKILSGEDPVATIAQIGSVVSLPPGTNTPDAAAPGTAHPDNLPVSDMQSPLVQPGVPAQGQSAPPGTADQDSGLLVVQPPAHNAAQTVEPGQLPSAPGDTPLWNETPVSPAPNLLMVPGAIEPPPPAAREDAVVRPAFITDIAAFLAQSYWPRGAHPSAVRSGITTLRLRWANLRYGAELQGLDGRRGDPRQARTAILGYVLNPATVTHLYSLYADSFAEALAQEADKRVIEQGPDKRLLTQAEKKELFSIYARYAATLGSALGKYAADPAMSGRVKAFAQAEETVHYSNRVYMESMLAHEQAQEKGSRQALNAARLRMDKDAATYQKRIREREAARERLVAAMSPDNNPRSPSADTLVYTAFWAYRRGPDSASALTACAKALNDMSAKLTAMSRQIQ